MLQRQADEHARQRSGMESNQAGELADLQNRSHRNLTPDASCHLPSQPQSLVPHPRLRQLNLPDSRRGPLL